MYNPTKSIKGDTMKKTLLLLLAMMVVGGCTIMQNTTPGAIATYGKYPECQEIKAQAEWMQCVQEIQQKEGRIR